MGKIFVERERSGERLYGQETREKGKVVVLIIYYIGIVGTREEGEAATFCAFWTWKGHHSPRLL